MAVPYPAPLDNSQIDADQAALEQAILMQQQMDEQRKKLLAMANAIKDPFEAMQVLMLDVIPTEMSEQESGISQLAGSSNIMSDIRNMLAEGQNDIGKGGDTTPAQAKAFADLIDQLEAKLNDPNFPIDPSNRKNMLDAIKDIKAQFGNAWGDGRAMAMDMKTWGIYDKMGQPSQQMKTITNDVQTLNQSVSALSTTTNTQLQFQTEQYKQIMGTLNDMFKTEIQQIATPIQNERPS